MALTIVPALPHAQAAFDDEPLGPEDGNHGNHAGDDRPEDDLLLPRFEGQIVEELRVKLPGVSTLDLDADPHKLDDIVRLVVTARINRVDHLIDERSGRLVRTETLKVIEALEVPWEAVCAIINEANDGDGLPNDALWE